MKTTIKTITISRRARTVAPKGSPTAPIGSPAWWAWFNSFPFRGYDHIHWSRINGPKLDAGMGTLDDATAKPEDTGKVVLLGRSRTGYHHTLYGPITAEDYAVIVSTHETRKADAIKYIKVSRGLIRSTDEERDPMISVWIHVAPKNVGKPIADFPGRQFRRLRTPITAHGS